jgi:1-acyl-sn-glycerol-3-phosphate acyltransferase
MARHAGPGDSFLVVHALLNWYDREPRIVLKNTLQWDPAIDVLLNRLPNRFIAPNPGAAGDETERHIAELAAGLDHDDSLVIFPEGGNFTTARRHRAIARLRRGGHQKAAFRAERMVNVLPPRPGGVTAALRAATDADAVFVAHTGLEHLVTVGDLWRALPMDTEVRMHWWRVPAAEVPRDEHGIVEWLFGWWETVDAWIGVHKPVP